MRRTHTSHWGAFSVEVEGDRIVAVTPHPDDPDPSPLLANVAGATHDRSRVASPMVREGWWRDGAGPDERRGRDRWLRVGWDAVLDRLADELAHTRQRPEDVYAGSYGWASAGRFHHAQSQLRRFFSLYGGSTVSVGTYSSGAAEWILPHVVGSDEQLWRGATAWPVIAEHTELLVAFGGLPAKNSSVSPGGVTRHVVGGALRRASERGMQVVNVSPLRDDVAAHLGAEWVPIRPGTDTALMLALARQLLADGSADLGFCRTHTSGHERFVASLHGAGGRPVPTPEWASAITGIPAATIVELARRMPRARTLITTSWSLQRAEFGEQPVWASIALACLLGQVGLPGGGFGNGYASMADVGGGTNPVAFPAVPKTAAPLRSWIPVARVSDMLLHPGEVYEVNGQRRTYPQVTTVWWAGGNPFHHHQDLNKLRRALRRPDTVVVLEPYLTAMARHADVVLPTTVTLERDDVAVGRGDGRVIAMQAALPRYGEARHDHEVYAALAERLGFGDEFTEGRDATGWLRHLWGKWQRRCADAGIACPDFDAFWAAGEHVFGGDDDHRVYLSAYRADATAAPLNTPSGRIELWSATVDGFGYDDCPGTPTWLEPDEWAGSPLTDRWPLVLIANNPAGRLHGQLDAGAHSAALKVGGREPLRMHPADAAARGLVAGDLAVVENDRGRCLAGVVVTDDVSPGVVQLSTGAWYDPDDPAAEAPMCVHGNPNVLTADRGTSRLAQATTGQHALVEVRRFEGAPPPVRAHEPPVLHDP